MKLDKYLWDKKINISILAVGYFIIVAMLVAFKAQNSLIIGITIVYIAVVVASFLIDFFRKKNFYDEFTVNTEKLDKKYLVLEMLKEPKFYEGKILYDNLYEIDKSMAENVNKYNHSIEDFKEYIEQWIHEVKTPITAMKLLCENNRSSFTRELLAELENVQQFTEQALYYARSEHTEKDYSIREKPYRIRIIPICIECIKLF